MLDYIAYGALLSLLVHNKAVHLGNAHRIAGVIVCVSGVLALVVLVRPLYGVGPMYQALADLPFTWGAIGVILFGIRRDAILFEETGRTRASGVLPFFGYISYGLYLINVFVFIKVGELFAHLLPSHLQNVFAVRAGVMSLCIAISVLVAYLSRRYFEEPFLALKHKRLSFGEGTATTS